MAGEERALVSRALGGVQGVTAGEGLALGGEICVRMNIRESSSV